VMENDLILNQKTWGIDDHVMFLTHPDTSLIKIFIKLTSGPSATIFLHGAHVESFNNGKENLLFLSEKSSFSHEKAIRGGIPVIFPQFGPGELPQHGFARNSNDWKVHTTYKDPIKNSVSVTLSLSHTTSTSAVWPYQWKLLLTTTIEHPKDEKPILSQSMQVFNTGPDTFSFTCALHTYFNVKNIKNVTVRNLNGLTYLDKLSKKHVPNKIRI